MGYWLFAILLVELAIFYIGNGKNVVSPSFIGCSAFLLSTGVYLSAGEYYGHEIRLKTLLVITLLLMCLFLGELFGKRIRVKVRHNVIVEHNEAIVLSRCVIVALTIVVLVMAVLLFKCAYEFSLKQGNIAGNFITMTKFIREAKTPMQLPMFISQGKVVSECIVWLCVYCICRNKNATGMFYSRYLFPIFPYSIMIFAIDNRVALLKMVAVISIIAFVFVKQKKGWSRKGNTRILIGAAVAICLFLVLFRMLGYRTETSLRNELWDNITEYTSAGIVGLDIYLEEGQAANTLFGQSTLKGIYNILRQWGMPIPVVDSFEAFYEYAQGNSNAYTAFKAYIHDYTLLGAAVAFFLFGALLSCVLKDIQCNGAGFVRLCIVGQLFYIVSMISIADTTPSFLAMGTVYQLVYLYIFNGLFITKTIRIRRR